MKLFDSNSPVFQGTDRISAWFLVSICWIVCCLPVITILPACIALYDTAVRCILGSEGKPAKRFFRTFKNELGRGILLTLEWAVLIAILLFGFRALPEIPALAMIYLVTMLICAGILCWLVALESRFVYPYSTLHRNALIFTFAYLPQTFGMVLVLAAGCIAVYFVPVLFLLMPGIIATAQSVPAEKILIRYMPEEGY